jgi:hypothetical protein
VAKEPSQRRVRLLGSRISATHLPHTAILARRGTMAVLPPASGPSSTRACGHSMGVDTGTRNRGFDAGRGIALTPQAKCRRRRPRAWPPPPRARLRAHEQEGALELGEAGGADHGRIWARRRRARPPETGGSCSCCREVGQGRSRGVRRRSGQFREASAVMEGLIARGGARTRGDG